MRNFQAGHHPRHCENFLDPVLCMQLSKEFKFTMLRNVIEWIHDMQSSKKTFLMIVLFVNEILHTRASNFTSNIPFLGGISHTTEP